MQYGPADRRRPGALGQEAQDPQGGVAGADERLDSLPVAGGLPSFYPKEGRGR